MGLQRIALLDGQHVAAGLLVEIHHAGEAALSPNETMSGNSSAKGSSPMMSRAHQTAWPRPMRRLLAGEADGAGRLLQVALSETSCSSLPALGQRVDQLGLNIEIVLDHMLVAAGHENDVLDARLKRLVDGILHDGTIDDGQHFLRHRLGGGQEIACPDLQPVSPLF